VGLLWQEDGSDVEPGAMGCRSSSGIAVAGVALHALMDLLTSRHRLLESLAGTWDALD
jgi:hypothetical protein